MFGKLGTALALVVLLLAIAPAGAPVQVSYVYSDSMEPTIGTNDGFLLVPADSVEPGDVVTFRAPRRDDYVTHRVVDRSPSGFVTRGDNNPTTDQAAGYSPVERSEIVGEVLTYGGDPVTIPGYGTVATAAGEYRRLLLVGLGLLLLALSLRATVGPRSSRSVLRVRDALFPLFAVGVVSAIGFVLLGAAVHQMTFVALAVPSDAPNTLTVGEARTTTLTVNRSASPFTRMVVGAEGMHVTDRTRNESHVAVTARIPPPESTGQYATRLTVRRYPAVLPSSQLRRLERIHPAVPATITVLVVLAPLYLLALLAIDRRAPVRPSRSRWLHRLDEVFR